ncbi:HAMP domain-containing sensor histidine kinase [Nucisporomicrobium flavum]|uniref:HAMP domain-containing sensor histidine kinase n=1 Tax=Nucisporomicrobium flavum TaxID=2785915 RepID=UPI003C2C53EE
MTHVLRRNLRARLLLGWFALLTLGFLASAYAWDVLHWIDQGPGCALAFLPASIEPCNQIQGDASWKLRAIVYALLLVVLVAGARALAGWSLRPVRDMVPVIAQVGPQNLGLRVTGGGRHDELAALSGALNTMMDRIVAGYEGQRRFAANASHELRTPLAVQRTLIEVGMSGTLTEDQLSLLTAQLLRANERNERLIEGLLVLTEVDQARIGSTPQPLERIAGGVLAAYEEQAKKAGVTVTAELRPREVPGDEVLLERLITNLVQNGIKYNRPGGTLHVTVGGSPALAVVNTGSPVPAEAVPGLFEPFKRLGSDRIDHSGGAGLGLAIARSVVQAHHGTIAAEPGPDGGLRVSVDLPPF